jgi:predicted TIM-barrel enzyme
MGSFRDTFKRRQTFLPVIHVADAAQAERNTQIAINNGADGVFLINNHGPSWQGLLRIYHDVKRKHPKVWVGLNCLDLGQSAVSSIPSETAGLWVDNAGITVDSTIRARDFLRLQATTAWRGIYFGGVAFKYQSLVSDVATAAKSAVSYVDVVTTSGDATGSAPSVEKITTMKRAVGAHPLAIASGMTPENVPLYHMADCFLVATGISSSYHELDARKVRQFADRLRR